MQRQKLEVNTINKELDYIPSSESKGLAGIYTSHRVLTVEFPPSDQGDIVGDIQLTACADVVFGYHEDELHQYYHLNGHHDIRHHKHLIKGTESVEALSVKEVQCIINRIKQEENKRNLCLDGKSNCLLTDNDANQIMSQYSSYYDRQKSASPTFFKPKRNPKLQLRRAYGSFLSSAFYSMLETVLDRYLHAFLLDHGVKRTNAILIIEGVKAAALIPFTAQLSSIGIGALIQMMTKLILNKINLNPSLTNALQILCSKINTFYQFKSDQDVLVNTFLKNAGIATGTFYGYEIIRKLPKLRTEPVAAPVEDNSNHHSTSVGMRRRQHT